ncbi:MULTISPECIES: hypothetical protein [Sphingobium]|nr:hypothetical protein [Sphingobium indicum]
MPTKLFEATALSVADLPRTANLIALSSNELMIGRKLAYQPDNDALSEGAFWVEYMEAEDDCMVARHVVPYATFAPAIWHAIAADMFEEPADEQDASQIDRLVQRRGIFPHDPAAGPRHVAIFSCELSSLLERDLEPDSSGSNPAQLRIDTLDRLSGHEPDFYADPNAGSRPAWDALSVTMFERSCTTQAGARFEILFDRPDLTTGTSLGHAHASLFELQEALAGTRPSIRETATFRAYINALAEPLLASRPILTAIHNDRTGAFKAVTNFLENHSPGWSDDIPRPRPFSALLPLPHDWNGQVHITGLVQSDYARKPAETLGVAPELFGLYAGRSDGSTVWIGAAPCEADAHALAAQLN